ncbi:MAG: amidohydrolase family protein [Pigmentiphaga sp.]|uniref:amidohydrolase family protein n=1 Tax=Pigmentiphaga sp. TaxID=1977564 RepID=UPI0029BC96B4|nr:amidohydrolase family protein [Pigmentiphaga sp.]MDX3906506.1 amidohydrolase family protein [Pigmentiphaga sp.]
MSACGCAHGAVDVHTHFVPSDLPACPGESARRHWPTMQPAAQCGHKHVMIDGRNFRTVSAQCWDAELRLSDMQKMGVRHQVVSPMPELLSYWMQPADARALLRSVNEQIAEFVRARPDAFTGLCAVPLQDVDLAVEELDYAMGKLGLAGVEIGTNIGGVPIGHPSLEPFFSAAARLGAAVFVHPIRPAGADRLVGPPVLEQAVAFPGETGLAAVSAMTGDLLGRHPGLRLGFSHGGGTLAALLPRLRHARRAFPVLAQAVTQDPYDYARRFFYDTLVYDRSTLARLIELFGASQLMLGTDYPFAIMEHEPLVRLDELGAAADVLRALRRDNALRFIGRTAS